MNNLIITTRQSPVRLMVDYVATTILWTLFALFIFLFAMDLLTGYYWQSEARSRLQFYFLLAVANAVVLIFLVAAPVNEKRQRLALVR